jgi:hypothetical protein
MIRNWRFPKHLASLPTNHRAAFGLEPPLPLAQPEAFLDFEKPVDISAAVSGKFQQKLSLMAAVGTMPNTSWKVGNHS